MVLLCSCQGVLSVLLQYVVALMFWKVAKVLLCSYQGVLSGFECVVTVCICSNILEGYQGVTM